VTHRDVAYLNHILDAISDIEESVGSHSKEEFLELKDVRDANVRRLEIIGEATKNVSTSTRDKYNSILWKDIAGTRDKIAHHYFGINFEIVWNIIKNDIPPLKKQILKMRLELESNV